MYRISTDWENPAEQWWHIARSRIDNAPESLRPLLDVAGPDSILVADNQAIDILDWCQGIPGWDNGPDYARCALQVLSVPPNE